MTTRSPNESGAEMHSELVLGDIRERAHALMRLVACLLIDALFLAAWIALQLFAERHATNGIQMGGWVYQVSTNTRLVLALASLIPIALFLYADALVLTRKVSAPDSDWPERRKDLISHVQSGDDRLPLECPPRQATLIYVHRVAIFFVASAAEVSALIAVVSTGATPQFGISIASVLIILALLGSQLRMPFLSSTLGFVFSLSAAAALLGTLVLAAELAGLSPTLTGLVMLGGIVVGADLTLVWKAIRAGWAERLDAREAAFGKHYVIKETDGHVAKVVLDDRAPTRELVQKAYRAISRVPATPKDAEEIRDLEIVGRKCWRKYNQILALIAMGAHADISLYRKARLDEDRVVRYCEQLLAETRQLGSSAAPRHRVYSGMAGRRQLKELLYVWKVALSEIIESERALGVDNAMPPGPSNETKN